MTWVTAELGDVLLYPLQTFPLVFQSIVDAAALEHFLAGEETVRPDAVVGGDNNNVHLTGNDKSRAIEICIRIRVETATLDEDIDG